MGASAFTAHPHVDPARKRLVGWTWTNLPRSDSMRLALVEWDEEWNVQVGYGLSLLSFDFAEASLKFYHSQNSLQIGEF